MTFHSYRGHQAKDHTKRRSKKKKRNILRDPDDKRIPIKKTNSAVYKHNSRKRQDGKKSLDSRINGQNILQMGKKSSFYYKDEAGNIVIMSDSKSRLNDRSALVPSDVNNVRGKLFDSKDSQAANKINRSELYSNKARNTKNDVVDKPYLKRKTSRPIKSRRFTRARPTRGCDSVRDPKATLEKRENSLPTQSDNLSRQKTFESKATKDSITSKSTNKFMQRQNVAQKTGFTSNVSKNSMI